MDDPSSHLSNLSWFTPKTSSTKHLKEFERKVTRSHELRSYPSNLRIPDCHTCDTVSLMRSFNDNISLHVVCSSLV